MVWMVTYSFTIISTATSSGTVSEIQSWLQPFTSYVYANAYSNSGQIHISNVNKVTSYTPLSISTSFGNQSYMVVVNASNPGPALNHIMGANINNTGSLPKYSSFIKAIRIA